MPIKCLQWITRDFVRAHPDARFVFGDNVARRGYGGQAREMRGEPNAIGIAVKWSPGRAEHDYFRDDDPRCWAHVRADLARVEAELRAGRVVYVPADGIGTGLAQLPTRAPKLFAHLSDRINAMMHEGCDEARPEI